MIELPESWREWRTRVDNRLDRQEEEYREISKELVVLQTRQEIARDNEAARHSRTPQLILNLVSLGVGILIFILQLIIARAGSP